jgi:hypothetical protein
MSFVAELRDELVAAAEREQARRVPSLRAPGPRLVLAVGAAAALLLVVVLAATALDPRPVGPGERPTPAPTPAERPLFGGTLEPGVRYRTSEFVPALSFIVGDDRWMAVDTTLVDELRLARVDRGAPPPDAPRIQQLLFQRISEVVDPSVRSRQAARIPVPADLPAWLREHPDLRVGPARPVTVANVPGERFDIRARFDEPAHRDPWCERYAENTCTLLAPGLNPADGMHLRMTVLRTEPQPLVITLGAMSEADLAAVERVARPVLESLRIGVR